VTITYFLSPLARRESSGHFFKNSTQLTIRASHPEKKKREKSYIGFSHERRAALLSWFFNHEISHVSIDGKLTQRLRKVRDGVCRPQDFTRENCVNIGARTKKLRSS